MRAPPRRRSPTRAASKLAEWVVPRDVARDKDLIEILVAVCYNARNSSVQVRNLFRADAKFSPDVTVYLEPSRGAPAGALCGLWVRQGLCMCCLYRVRVCVCEHACSCIVFFLCVCL